MNADRTNTKNSHYMRQCIQSTDNVRWPEEALGRARFHLSKIYRQQGIEDEETRDLEAKAMAVLKKYSSTTPAYLQGVKDEMMLFDDLQLADSGRFTGRALLRHIQQLSSQVLK